MPTRSTRASINDSLRQIYREIYPPESITSPTPPTSQSSRTTRRSRRSQSRLSRSGGLTSTSPTPLSTSPEPAISPVTQPSTTSQRLSGTYAVGWDRSPYLPASAPANVQGIPAWIPQDTWGIYRDPVDAQRDIYIIDDMPGYTYSKPASKFTWDSFLTLWADLAQAHENKVFCRGHSPDLIKKASNIA